MDEALSTFTMRSSSIPSSPRPMAWRRDAIPQRKASGWMEDKRARRRRREAGAEAAQIGRDDAVALYTAGLALVILVGELDDGAALIERALRSIQPGMGLAVQRLDKVWQGDPEMPWTASRRGQRLSPQDPQFFNMRTATAWAHLLAGRYGEAQKAAQAALGEQPDYVNALYALAASSALAGQTALARDAWRACGSSIPARASGCCCSAIRCAGPRTSPRSRTDCAAPACRSNDQVQLRLRSIPWRFHSRGRRSWSEAPAAASGGRSRLRSPAAGADVAICARGSEGVRAVEAELRQHGTKVFGMACDLGDEFQVTGFVNDAAKALGGIDVLVNNASGMGMKDDESGWAPASTSIFSPRRSRNPRRHTVPGAIEGQHHQHLFHLGPEGGAAHAALCR